MLSARFEEALVYAARLHARQQRKATQVPYVAHLMSVAALVLEYGGGEDEAIAALLHDAVEDQGGSATRGEICRRFGEDVASIVDGCSDTDVEPKPPWRARKEAHLAHMRHASPAVQLVTAADKLHNARSLLEDYRLHGERLWQRFNGGKDGTLWYYRVMVGALSGAPAALVCELDRVVSELERLSAASDA
jgi:GTP pyrophosphokinase